MVDRKPARDTACDYSAIVPAYNAGATIQACLEAIVKAVPPPSEIIVFDDGSTDDTAEIARRCGARVVRGFGSRNGPAHGRNTAAQAARTTFLVFIDADVVIAPDAPVLLLGELRSHPHVAAAFGSYGTRQATLNLAARYANLRHHFYHQNGLRDAETFWTGLGAVSRSEFLSVGGFDEAQRLEDVEFGIRFREQGHGVRLVADAQGTHLKNWSLLQLWHDDIFVRAAYWSQLMIAGRGTPTLNTAPRERAIALLAHLIWMSAIAGLLHPAFLVVSGGLALGFIAANRSFLALLFRHGGWMTAIAGTGLHWFYYLYASGVFAVLLLHNRTSRVWGQT